MENHSNSLHNTKHINNLVRSYKLNHLDGTLISNRDNRKIQTALTGYEVSKIRKLLVKLIDDKELINRQTDLFYRYLDVGNIIEFDLDRYCGTFAVTKVRTELIKSALVLNKVPFKCSVKPIYKTQLDKRYQYSYQLSFGNQSSFFISFLSNQKGNNIRIDLVPTQIRTRVLKQFFNWFYTIAQVSESRLTCCDIGFSMHGLHHGLINFSNNKYTTFRTIPEVDPYNDSMVVETEYVPPNINNQRTITNTKLYSPSLRLLRENDSELGRFTLLNTQTCTRIESSCKPKGSLYYDLSFGDIAKTPCTLKDIKLVSPSIFLDIDRRVAFNLIKYKLNHVRHFEKGCNDELEQALAKHSVKIPSEFVDREIKSLANRYEPILAAS